MMVMKCAGWQNPTILGKECSCKRGTIHLSKHPIIHSMPLVALSTCGTYLCICVRILVSQQQSVIMHITAFLLVAAAMAIIKFSQYHRREQEHNHNSTPKATKNFGAPKDDRWLDWTSNPYNSV